MSSPSSPLNPPSGKAEEKAEAILKAIGVVDPSKLSRADAVIAMGRLLSIKARPSSSVHEVTKEVRGALKLAMRNPLREDIDSVVKTTIHTDPPFRNPALREAYKRILAELIRKTLEASKQLSPMWRRKLINLTIENIYNVATSEMGYREGIFEMLRGEGVEGEVE